MDIANQLFSLTVGVEPNKQTIQTLAGHLNNAGKLYDPKSNYEPLLISTSSPLPRRQAERIGQLRQHA